MADCSNGSPSWGTTVAHKCHSGASRDVDALQASRSGDSPDLFRGTASARVDAGTADRPYFVASEHSSVDVLHLVGKDCGVATRCRRLRTQNRQTRAYNLQRLRNEKRFSSERLPYVRREPITQGVASSASAGDQYGVVQVIPDKPITITRMSSKPDIFFNKRLKLTKEKADAKDKRNDSIQVSQAR